MRLSTHPVVSCLRFYMVELIVTAQIKYTLTKLLKTDAHNLRDLIMGENTSKKLSD